MRQYIKPETKEIYINADSLMEDELAIVSDPNKQITDSDQFLGNEDHIWEENAASKKKSVWE